MTHVDQVAVVVRAVEGGAFAEALYEWRDAPGGTGYRSPPTPEEQASLARILREAEATLGEPIRHRAALVMAILEASDRKFYGGDYETPGRRPSEVDWFRSAVRSLS